MSTIAFDGFYLDNTLFSTNGLNGVLINNNLAYTMANIPLANYSPQVLVPAGSVLTAINSLQAQLTALQNQVNNIPQADQNVNIVPGELPNQYYLRANVGSNQFNILSTVFVPPS